jgi:ribosome recycling factor
MNDPLNPFDEAGIQRVLHGIEQANVAIAAAEKGARAGIDMSAVKKLAEDKRDQLLLIKQTYFPHR